MPSVSVRRVQSFIDFSPQVPSTVSAFVNIDNSGGPVTISNSEFSQILTSGVIKAQANVNAISFPSAANVVSTIASSYPINVGDTYTFVFIHPTGAPVNIAGVTIASNSNGLITLELTNISPGTEAYTILVSAQ